MKILVIDDNQTVVQRFIRKFKDTEILVYPHSLKHTNDFEDFSFVTEKDYGSIAEHFSDIDLFIIGVTPKDGKVPELDFLNYLKNINYRNGNYDYLFLIAHSESNNQLELVKHAIDNQKIISKEIRISGDYTDLVSDYINKNFNQNLTYNQSILKIQKMENRYKAYLEKGISIVFLILIVISVFYALINISGDFIKILRTTSFEPLQNAKSLSEAEFQQMELMRKRLNIEKIKVVENIFIYILPTFIIMGFYSYFKNTTSVMLTGGKGAVEDGKAMKSLNASKSILFTSILAFTIIKMIEILALQEDIKIESILSFGGLTLILMIFTILFNKQGYK